VLQLTLKCSNCSREITWSGYEFGEELRWACHQCSCGARVYIDRTPKETYEKLGIKQREKVCERHKRRFHCRTCNDLIVRKRSEKDELSALQRHYREAHPDLPLPHSYIIADCDLTKNEKDCLKELNEYVRELQSVIPDVLREMKKKGLKTPDLEDKKHHPKKRKPFLRVNFGVT